MKEEQPSRGSEIVPASARALARRSNALAMRGLRDLARFAPPDMPPTLTLNCGGGVMMELILIPAGTFIMGSPEDEEGRLATEGPQHEVTISKAFYMGKYPITQGQWRAVAGTTVAEQRDKANPEWPLWGEGSDYPIYCVSWNDCQDFCKKLSVIARRAVRLPTEAEWEYACRAGSTTPFYCGHTLSPEQANYDPYEQEPEGVFRNKSTRVGSFPANAWGLYDMHGNDEEWCADWYDAYPGNGASSKTFGHNCHVLRGGSWLAPAADCRSARREFSRPNDCLFGFGLRVAADAE